MPGRERGSSRERRLQAAAGARSALGATHVGQETSADTAYMEIREQRLPGDRVTAYVPVKVYRGRARGSNVPAVPTVRYTGDLRDTAQVEAFVGGLR
jgi:hypothetical protein